MGIFSIFRKYNEFCERIKKERKENEIKEIRNTVYMNELNGHIYIVCNGYAVYKAMPEETSQQIVATIEKIRKVTLDYKEKKSQIH